MPQSNSGFWKAKLARNITRDRNQIAAIRAMGWRVLVVWECQTKDRAHLASRISCFLAN